MEMHMEKMNFAFYLIQYKKFKVNHGRKYKKKTINFLKEKLEYLCDLGKVKGFLDRSQKTLTIKEKHQ